LKKSEDTLKDELEAVNMQLMRLRAARHELELDLRNKDEAKKTDECVKILNRLSTEIGPIDMPDNVWM